MKRNCWYLLLLLLYVTKSATAQNLLHTPVTLDVKNQRLDQVLEIISNKGNFYFSYNSSFIKSDSLITINVANKTVKQILDLLLPDHYQFQESGNYIIIRKEPVTVSVFTNQAITEDKFYTVRGYVMDDESGAWIHNASVYEKTLLASTLTNTEGYFKLRLKQKAKAVNLTVSKEFYRDTSFAINPGYNQQVTITLLPVTSGLVTIISPEDYFAPDELKLRVKTDSTITEYTYIKTHSAKVELHGIGRFLISSQQRIQSLNLKKFFTTRPFQISFTPGLGTHGKLSAQVNNNFSFNVLGGYNGGVQGFEIGGLFNIDKKSVRYLQIGGLFNMVGGYMKGVQIGGISNTVLDTVEGLQIGGVSNIVKGKFTGFQLGGIYNHVSDSLKGFQLAGVANFAKNKASGLQFAGVANVSNREMDGTQISGLFNYAKKLKGVQIGLINVADTSEGYSIGLINIVLNGYHKLSFSADEVINLNAAFKTGNEKLYSILKAGLNVSDSQKVYTFGYGIGSALRMGKTFSLNPEITAQHLYLGSWNYINILSKAHLNVNVRLNKYVSLFGGPVFNIYYSNQEIFSKGYRTFTPPSWYHSIYMGPKVKGWFGWNAGFALF